MNTENPAEGKVSITFEEYRRLLRDSYFLRILESCGVDNWEGYDKAILEFNRNEENDYES
jgi:hypothetical protein